MNPWLVFLTGACIGVLSYVCAEALIPRDVASPGNHDLYLADRLVFIYTPAVGLWLGWLQRSRRREYFGVAVGIGIGFIWRWFGASPNVLAISIGLPCLLGGVLSAVVGSNRSRWLKGISARLGKGLLAGFVLGFVYRVVLYVLGDLLRTDLETTPTADEWKSNYLEMMWRTGPIALGLSSALFFILIRWAVGLTRVKRFVFEDVEAEKSP